MVSVANEMFWKYKGDELDNLFIGNFTIGSYLILN